MVKIQIELTSNENKIVEIFKAKNSNRTKELAIKMMIRNCK